MTSPPVFHVHGVCKTYRTLTVVITHNAAIAGMADRVIRISSGEIVEVRRNEARRSPAELSW